MISKEENQIAMLFILLYLISVTLLVCAIVGLVVLLHRDHAAPIRQMRKTSWETKQAMRQVTQEYMRQVYQLLRR